MACFYQHSICIYEEETKWDDTRETSEEKRSLHKSKVLEVIERTFSCDSFPHFMYVHGLVKRFARKLKDVMKDKVDCSIFNLEDPKIKLRISGDTAKENLRLLSKRKAYQATNDESYWPASVNVYFEYNCDHQEKDKIQLPFEELSYTNQVVRVKQVCTKDLQSPSNFVHFVENEKNSVREAITKCLEVPLCTFLESLKPILENSRIHSKITEEATSLMKLLKRWDTDNDILFSYYQQQSHIHGVPRNIHDHLIRRHGVNAFGIWKDRKFKVFIEKGIRTEELKEELEKIDEDFFREVKLKILAKDIDFQPYLKQGDDIFRDNDLTSKSEELGANSSHATLGAFVRNQVSVDDLYILTCGHIFPCVEMCAYGKLNEHSVTSKIGTCIFSNLPGKENFIDFSVVQVSEDIKQCCELAFMRSENQKCNAIVYTEHIEDTKDYVHKKGAASGWTDGRIQCSNFVAKLFGNRNDVFLVLGKGGTFCEPGDSGSIVFTPDNSPDQEEVHVLGMLMGSMQDAFSSSDESNSDSETTKKEATQAKDSRSEENPEEVNEDNNGAFASSDSFKRKDDPSKIASKELAVCFRIDSALQLLKEKKNLDVEFEKISLSSDESD